MKRRKTDACKASVYRWLVEFKKKMKIIIPAQINHIYILCYKVGPFYKALKL